MPVILATWEAEILRTAVLNQPMQKVSFNQPVLGHSSLSSQQSRLFKQEDCCPCWPVQKVRPYFKITRANWAGVMVQKIAHLPSKLKALSSNPGTALHSPWKKKPLKNE
jgi:hypothetical protein